MLILLEMQSSIFLFFINYLILTIESSQNEIKMKSNKSQKKITIITDRKAQHDLLNQRNHSSLTKGSQTCTNQARGHLTHQQHLPMSCKNFTQQAEVNQNLSRSVSAQKHKRQRSSSLQGREESAASQQNRKKELDYLCFQRLINIFKKYLLERQENWNLECLCYGQLLKLLWLCRFVPYQHEEEYIENNEQGELKKVYLLWLSIAYKKCVNFRDILNFVQLIENINVDQEKADALLFSFQSEIKGLCFKEYEDFKEDPNYTFFIKRIELKRNQNNLLSFQTGKQKILPEFKSFKLNKLKNSGLFECVKVEEEQVLVSKKSSELADQKRKKIEDKIRQKKPHVENINLLDLLSYRQRDHLQTAKKVTVPIKKKSTTNLKRGEFKKEIEMLSRPKTYFQERKQDEIDFQREEEEYTFHPKINPYKGPNQEKVMQIKNADKVLVRMKEARKQKEEKEIIMQKGWSNIAKNETSKPFSKQKSSLLSSTGPDKENVNVQREESSENEKQLQKRDSKPTKYEVSKDYLRIPILYIDVNIEEGKKERIIIYDNDKAQTLAKEFGQKHKLTAETVGRLQILLQQQMDTVLARIDEETDDECSIIY